MGLADRFGPCRAAMWRAADEKASGKNVINGRILTNGTEFLQGLAPSTLESRPTLARRGLRTIPCIAYRARATLETSSCNTATSVDIFWGGMMKVRVIASLVMA